MNAVETACAAVRETKCSIVVVTPRNEASSARCQQVLPTMNPTAIEQVGDSALLRFGDWIAAGRAYERLTGAEPETNDGSAIDGTVTLVSKPHRQEDSCVYDTWTSTP